MCASRKASVRPGDPGTRGSRLGTEAWHVNCRCFEVKIRISMLCQYRTISFPEKTSFGGLFIHKYMLPLSIVWYSVVVQDKSYNVHISVI